MKNNIQKLSIILLSLLITPIAFAQSEAGNPPEGEIEISPDQKCEGKSTVGIGKELTFTAISLKDEDQHCGETVNDSIEDPEGIKWTKEDGEFTGGDKGGTKKWTAPDETSAGLKIALELDDLAEAENTTDDGGFEEVKEVNVAVVKPNLGSNDTPTHQACPDIITQQQNPQFAYMWNYGRWKHYKVTGERQGCAVDFKDCYVNESGARAVAGMNGCQVGAPSGPFNQGNGVKLDGSNWTIVAADVVGICNTLNTMPPNNQSMCSSVFEIDWSIRSPSGNGAWLDWGQFSLNYFIDNVHGIGAQPPGGGVPSGGVVVSRSWKKAL